MIVLIKALVTDRSSSISTYQFLACKTAIDFININLHYFIPFEQKGPYFIFRIDEIKNLFLKSKDYVYWIRFRETFSKNIFLT
jgi:hypothetical protein